MSISHMAIFVYMATQHYLRAEDLVCLIQWFAEGFLPDTNNFDTVIWGGSRGIVAHVLDCDIAEFEFDSRYNFTLTFELIPQEKV